MEGNRMFMYLGDGKVRSFVYGTDVREVKACRRLGPCKIVEACKASVRLKSRKRKRHPRMYRLNQSVLSSVPNIHLPSMAS